MGDTTYNKYPCGHPSCNQYILSTQGSVGFSEEDARLYSAAFDLLEALLTAKDYLDDIQKGALWCESNSDKLTQIPQDQVDEDLARINAAICKVRG